MWLERSARLITLLALLIAIAGLLVLALSDTREGPELVQLDATHSVRVADLVGAGLITIGALLIWAAVLAWQRRCIL